MKLNGDIRNYFNKMLNLPKKLQLFTDIRKYPVIDLRNIIVQLFLMPFFGMTSLLKIVGKRVGASYSLLNYREEF